MIKAIVLEDISAAIRKLESTGMYSAGENITHYGCDIEHCVGECECEYHSLEIFPFDFGQDGPIRTLEAMPGDIIVFEDDVANGPAILVMGSPASGMHYSKAERREYIARAQLSFSSNAEAAYEAGVSTNEERVRA